MDQFARPLRLWYKQCGEGMDNFLFSPAKNHTLRLFVNRGVLVADRPMVERQQARNQRGEAL